MKRKLWVLMAFAFTVIVLSTSLIADPLIPLPGMFTSSSTAPRETVELLTNTSFEEDTDNDNIPDGWTGVGTSKPRSDKRKCITTSATRQIFVNTGNCAFMFRGNPDGSHSKLIQTITDISPLVNGTVLIFSGYSSPVNIVGTTKYATAKIKYSDGNSTTLTLAHQLNFNPYRVSKVVVLPLGATVASAKITLRYAGNSGKYFVYDVNLVASPSPANKLMVAEGKEWDSFGNSVAIQGDTMVIGASEAEVGYAGFGKAYVYTRHSQGWVLDQELIPASAIAWDFGGAVDIDHNLMVISIWQHFYGPVGNAVYVFAKTNGDWVEQTILIPNEETSSPNFANELHLDGKTVAVSGSDVVYVFVRSNGIWEQQAIITGDPANTTSFARASALEGDTLVVGALDTDENFSKGKAYVYTRSDGVWSQQQELRADDSTENSWFGGAIALNGNTLMIGAAGAVYEFTNTAGRWTQTAKLTFNEANTFGSELALEGDTLLVSGGGAEIAPDQYQEVVYVFKHSNGVWTYQQTLFAEDGELYDGFGRSAGGIALSQDTALIGALDDNIGVNNSQGSAYFFDLVP